tara:strand:+ start:212 stop:334 length:123 start_codon:yes stop_codon:yes gene_type:complete
MEVKERIRKRMEYLHTIVRFNINARKELHDLQLEIKNYDR